MYFMQLIYYIHHIETRASLQNKRLDYVKDIQEGPDYIASCKNQCICRQIY